MHYQVPIENCPWQQDQTQTVRKRRAISLHSVHPWVGAVILAALIACWGARGINTYEFVDPDAAHHAMNGVLLHDWIAHGWQAHPVGFARDFYSHLPAISIPYHPPLFPAMEALFYFIGGVNGASARLAIAVTVFLAALLLYSLLFATHRSHRFALLCTAIIFWLPEFQRVSSDVMLEVPSLVFTLGALWCLWASDESLDMRHALMFGVLTAAAIWTKQHTVFLLACPFVVVCIRRDWNALRRAPLWIGTGIGVTAAAGLAVLARLADTGSNRLWGSIHFLTPVHNLSAYLWVFVQQNGVLPAILMGMALLAVCIRAVLNRTRRSEDIYLAWTVSAFGLLLALPFADGRYLFYIYAPLVVLAVGSFVRLGRRRMARQVIAFAGVALLSFYWTAPADTVSGTRQAAAAVMKRNPDRVLYVGTDIADFIFFVRERDPYLRTAIIRGDKMPAYLLEPNAFEKFVRSHGIEMVVVEQNPDQPAWSHLVQAAPPGLTELKTVIHHSPARSSSGPLFIYSVKDPAPHPKWVIHLASDLVRNGIDTELNN